MFDDEREPDYEAIFEDRQAERDYRANRRLDARYGRIEDWRKPAPKVEPVPVAS